MITRPLDANGDIMPVTDLSQMASGPEAVGIAIKHRCSMIEGEWWEDEELGFGIPDFLGTVRGDTGADMLARYVSGYIAATPGVTGVNGASVSYSSIDPRTGKYVHQVTYSADVETGETNQAVEVDLDGLL